MVDRIEIKEISQQLQSNPKINKDSNKTFLDMLKGYLMKVDMNQHKADKAIEDFLAGKKSIQQVMLTVEKADISFRLFMKIRNKLIEAYQEIMRMQV